MCNQNEATLPVAAFTQFVLLHFHTQTNMEAICSRSSTLVCGLPFPPSSSSSRHNTCCYAAAVMPSLNRRRPQLSCLTSRSSSGRRSKFVVTCGVVREIHEAEFSEVVLKSDRPVLVEFVAGWCGPCRLIAPAIESLQQEYEEKLLVVKIDHDSNPGLIEKYKVYGLPSLILFKDGKEVPQSRKEGAITKAKLKEYIDTLLASVSIA